MRLRLITLILFGLLASGPSLAQWQYRQTEDKMRGEVTNGAVSLSTNFVSLAFPYEGETRLGIFVLSRPNRTSVVISSTKGQLSCRHDGCHFFAKFDDEPISRFRASGDTNGNLDTLYLERTEQERFLQKLRSAKSVQIEVGFYREGRKQFSFDISDLKL